MLQVRHGDRSQRVGQDRTRDHQHVRTRAFVSVVRLANVRGNIFMLLNILFWIGLFDLPKNKIPIYFSENPIFDFDIDYFGDKRNTFLF